jgi:hypothetical protein
LLEERILVVDEEIKVHLFLKPAKKETPIV